MSNCTRVNASDRMVMMLTHSLRLQCARPNDSSIGKNATAIRVAVDGSDLSLAIAAMIVEKRNVSCE